MRRDGARLGLLAVCLAASLALYATLAIVLGSVPAGWTGYVGYSHASADVFRGFTHLPAVKLTPGGFQGAVAGLLLALWLVWIAAASILRGVSADARSWARAIVLGGGVALMALVVITLPPLLSADLYRQALFGDMVARHGLNPYATPVAELAGHPVLPFARESEATSIYGAAYTWLSALAAMLAPATAAGFALTWKAMSALAALGCAVVAPALAAALSQNAGGGGGADNGSGCDVQLWLAWNPLIVIEAAGSAHIEPVMMLPALAGLLLLRRGRPAKGFALLVVSALTKWVSGLLALVTAVQELRGAQPGGRLRALLRMVIPAALVTALLYAPFARGLTGKGGIHVMAMRGSQVFGDPTRNWIPQWLMTALFAAASAAVALAVPRGNWTRAVQATVALMLAFVLIVVPWIFPWYFIAPAVLAAVLPRDRAGFLARLICFGFGGAFMLYYAKLVPLR